MKRPSILLLGFLALSACAVQKPHGKNRLIVKEIKNSTVFSKAFTGFTLLDPKTGKTLVDHLGDHYFTPASNTKILTLAACLEVLGDSVPGMQLIQTDTKLLFRGTGDPTFLHPDFKHWQSCFGTLANPRYDSLIRCYYPRSFDAPRFGAGWAWDDYTEDYQAERSEMPIYGNLIQINSNGVGNTQITPDFFQKNWQLRSGGNQPGVVRIEYENYWTLEPRKKVDQVSVPMFHPPVDKLIADTIHRDIEDLRYSEHPYQNLYPTRTLYSAPIDTVLRRMMWQSDNFIAEQMLLVCAGVKYDFLQQDTVIKWMLDSVLTNLPQRPRWVDGSGLSRYNMNSPQSIAQVLLHLWKTQPGERLFDLFPKGGVNGTLESWYAGKNGKPYVFAKTGGLRGVACLSGYIKCNSGNVLIFSFMNNNFAESSRPWKAEMQRILELIRDRY
ncbi:MAG: D-alanyl-D-alanine carboxypeptidase [Saprospiraceae bacterium]|nr:D-alanyl-D-alanine carboxypeptidase [Saprospiraceae bacterium]